MKRKVDDGARAFGSQTLAVELLRESPTDFDSRLGQVGDDMAHDLHADGTDEDAG